MKTESLGIRLVRFWKEMNLKTRKNKEDKLTSSTQRRAGLNDLGAESRRLSLKARNVDRK